MLDAALGRHTFRFRVDFGRQRKLDRMRVAEREDDLLALHVGLVTDADDVHLRAETFGHADDGIVCQRAR